MVTFKNKSGDVISGSSVVFPITYKRGDEIIFWATGFFIQGGGGFISAAHNFYDKDELIIDDMLIVDYRSDKIYHPRKVRHIFKHKTADIVVGMLGDDIRNEGTLLVNNQLILSSVEPKIGDEVYTYAYPKNKVIKTEDGDFIGDFKPVEEYGKITDHFPNGRDKTFLPGKCYQTDILIENGASGGPVFNKDGLVVGINSTGYDGIDPPVSFITPISEVFQFPIPYAENKTIEELGKIGIISIE